MQEQRREEEERQREEKKSKANLDLKSLGAIILGTYVQAKKRKFMPLYIHNICRGRKKQINIYMGENRYGHWRCGYLYKYT